MNLIGFAHYAATGYTDFSELLDPRTLSLMATISRASHLKTEDKYPKDLALKDYFATLHVVAADAMLGRLEDGKQIYSFLRTDERDQFPGFIVDLSKHAPRFEDSVDNLLTLADEHLPHVRNYGTLFQDLAQKVDAQMKQPKSRMRQEQMKVLFEQFYDIRRDATGVIWWNLVSPFVHTAGSIKDSETAKILKTEKRELLELFAPSSGFGPDTMDYYAKMHNTIQAVVNSWPEYEPFIKQLLIAFKQDAVKIGVIIDRKPDETDAEYFKRIRPLMEIKWTKSQKQLLGFVKDRNASEEHEYVLAKMSELVDAPLKHADITPHVYAVADVAQALTDQAAKRRQGVRVIEGRPVSDVVKTRILVQQEGSDWLEEYNYATGESKGLENLNDRHGCLIAYTPVNVLNEKQYKVFRRLMSAMLSRW